MKDFWYEIEMVVSAEHQEQVVALLVEAGSEGVVVESRELDSFEVPEFPDQTEGKVTLKVFFPPTIAEEMIDATIDEALLPFFPYNIIQRGQVGETDWSEGWKQHFPVTRIGRLILRPSWEECDVAEDDILLTIDPGMAFGTGTHETTRLCLEAYVERAQSKIPATILDVGTGSGILAIAAALFGSEEIVACDIDPEACETTMKNATLNGVQKDISVSTTPLEDIPGSYDLIFANILAEENIRLAEQLVGHLKSDGLLVLSGILREKEGQVVEVFKQFGLSAPMVTYNNEWCAIQYQRIQ